MLLTAASVDESQGLFFIWHGTLCKIIRLSEERSTASSSPSSPSSSSSSYSTTNAHSTEGRTALAKASAWLMQQSGALPLLLASHRVVFPNMPSHNLAKGESALAGSFSSLT